MKRSSIVLMVVVAVILALLHTAHYRTKEEPIYVEKVVAWEDIRTELERQIQEHIQEAKDKGYWFAYAIAGEPKITQFRFLEIIGYRTVEYVAWLPWWMP